MSGLDSCIHGQPIDAYCPTCEHKRATPIERILDREPKGWTVNDPQPMRVAREDLIAIMATALVFAPEAGTLSPELLVEWASEIYDQAHKTQAAT